jgi:hypothetical protein
MREEEKFVIQSIATVYSGDWKPGSDPPDAYLTIADRTIAVEISMLTQHVTDDRGTRPRLSDDTAAIRLANELDAELKSDVSTGKHIMLVLSSPIRDYRKTKVELKNEIAALLSDSTDLNRAERKILIRGNNIEIYLYQSSGNEEKKIVATVKSRASNPSILTNVAYILEDRIKTKAVKCGRLDFTGSIWLALLNDYFCGAPL